MAVLLILGTRYYRDGGVDADDSDEGWSRVTLSSLSSIY